MRARSCCLAVTLLAMVSACSSGENPARSGAQAITMVFSYAEGGAGKQALMAKLARGFEAERPGVKVYLHPLPANTDSMRVFHLTSLASKSSYVDVIEADVIWTAEFAAAGLFKDLSSSKALADRDSFLPALLAQATYDGKLHAAPYYATFGTLFHRADLLRKHDLKPPASLKDLVDQAKKVGEAEKVDGLLFQAADYEGLACVFFELYSCFGDPAQVEGGKVRLNPDVTLKTLRFMHDAIHLHKITPADVLSHTEVDSTERFARGEALFMRGWSGSHGTVSGRLPKEAVGVSVMPASRGPLSGGFLLAVNSRTDVPEHAEAFVAYMVRPATQRLLAARRGQGSALKALYNGPERPPGLAADGLQGHVIRPRSPYYFELSHVLTEEIRAVLNEQRTVGEGARRITSRAAALKLSRRATPGFLKSNYMTRYRQ